MRSLQGTPADLDLSRAELTIRRRDEKAGSRPSWRDDVRRWPTSVELPKDGGTVTLAEWHRQQDRSVRLGAGHCCACTSVCGHIGGIRLCPCHEASASRQ